MRRCQSHKLVCCQSADLRRLQSRDFTGYQRSNRGCSKAPDIRKRTDVHSTDRNRIRRPDRCNLARSKRAKLRRRQRHKLIGLQNRKLRGFQCKNFIGRERSHRSRPKTSNVRKRNNVGRTDRDGVRCSDRRDLARPERAKLR